MGTASRSKDRFWLYVTVTGCLLGLVVLVITLSFLRSQLPGSWKNPPIYPDAQQVQITHGGEDAKCGASPHETISLLSRDQPEIVLAFYKDKLQSDGWRTGEGAVPVPGELTLFWTTGEDFSPMNIIIVSAQQTSTFSTQVTIQTRILCGL
jgi:hypothetical protein